MRRSLEAQWKMREQAILCIKNGRYSKAADFIITIILIILKGRTDKLGERKRDLKLSKVKEMIMTKHENLRSRYAAMSMNIKPMKIAEEVYNEVMLEFVPEYNNHKGVSEQLGHEDQ
jgi:hypothetical protein